jgi:ankyrin repeat protein
MKSVCTSWRAVAIGMAALAGLSQVTAEASTPQEWQQVIRLKKSREEFATLLGANADIYATEGVGSTIAQQAATAGRWDLVEELFSRGYNPLQRIPARHNPRYQIQRGVELLTEAARQGELTWLKKLLEAGVSPDTGVFEGGFQDALGLALANNHSEAALLLIRAGAPLHTQINLPARDLPEPFAYLGNRRAKDHAGSYIGNRPIHLAAMHRNSAVLTLLIRGGVDLDFSNDNGATALMIAAAGGWADGVEMLLEAGATRAGKSDIDGKLVIDHAEAHPAVRQILLRDKFHVHKGETPPPGIQLLLAVDAEDLTALRELIANPAAVGFVDENGMNALMFAVGWNRGAAMRFLVENKFDLNALSRSGNSALTFAVLRKQERLAMQLLEMGANPNAFDPKKAQSALELAVANRMFGLANALLDRGALPGGCEPTAAGFSAPPLHRAAAMGELALVQRLLEKGADVRELDSEGFGALMHACMANNAEIVQVLLKRGLSPNEPAPDGQTPLSMAVRKRNPAVVRALLAAGAKPDALPGALDELGFGNDEVAQQIFALLKQKHGDAYKEQVFWASSPTREQIMAFIADGGDPNPTNSAAPLQQALYNVDYELARFLLKHGAHPSAISERHFPPLTLIGYAQRPSDKERVAMARELIALGADANESGHGPQMPTPPLVAAIHTGCVPLVELFLSAGARTAPGWREFQTVADQLAPDTADAIENLLRKADQPKRPKVKV